MSTDSENGDVDLDQLSYRYRTKSETRHESHTFGVENSDTYSTDWTIYGKCGGWGGDGGKGGNGGRAGFVKIFELGKSSSIASNIATGTQGDNGSVGSNGSKPGKVTLTYERTTSSSRSGPHSFGRWINISPGSDDSCPDRPSSNSTNDNGIKNPEDASTYEPAIPINAFQVFLRENQKDHLKRDDIAAFVEQIHDSNAVLNNYTTLGFADELQSLEKQFFDLENYVKLAPYYRSVSQRIETFVKNNLPKDKKVFSYLYAAALGKYLALNSADVPNLIIDIRQYLDIAIGTIKKVEKATRVSIIDENKNSFKKITENKIAEATSFIGSDILPAIDNITKVLDSNLGALVQETVDLQNKSAADELKYLRKQTELSNSLAARSVFHVLSVFGSFAQCLGPYGLAAAGIANGVSQIGEAFTEDGSTGVEKTFSLPAGVKTALENLENSRKKLLENRVKDLDDELKRIAKKLEPHSSGSLKDTVEIIKKLQDELDAAQKSTEPSTSHAITDIENKLKAEMMKKAKFLNDEKEKLGDEGTKALKIVEKVNKGLEVFAKAKEAYKKFQDDQKKLDEVIAALAAAGDKLSSLRDFENKIYDVMWPMVDELRTKIAEVENSAAGKSHAALDVKKWKIQSVLHDTKFKLQKFTKDFNIQEDLLHTIDSLDEAFTTLINVYDRIESYHDQEKLADYMASIADTDIKKIQVNDTVLQSALVNLDVVINSNVLLTQFKLATDGFKQTIFPFASYYLDQYQLPAGLQLGNDTKTLVNAAITQLDGLKTKIAEYNSCIINEDQFIVTSVFDSRVNSSWPFYVWHSPEHKKLIGKLLSGGNITLRADIAKGLKLNAVKFNIINLFIRSVVVARQAELDQVLGQLDVKMVHMGNSYYRCGTKFYQISGPNETITFSFAQKDGMPIRRNGVYNKLMKGDLVLSPYAMWNVQLENVSGDKKPFDKLRDFVDHTDLYLTGHGVYVRNDVPVCGNDVEKYYRTDATALRASLNKVQ